MSILYLGLKYWQSDIPNNALYNVSSRYLNSWFSVIRGLASSILVSTECLKLVGIDWQIKSSIFLDHQNLDSPKFPKYAITFDLFWHSKSSLSATTGFISSTKVAIENFPLSRTISGFNYSFCSLRLTSDCPKKSKSSSQYGVFSIF